MESNTYPGSYYQPLFDLLNKEHGIIPLESEMTDIILVVEKMRCTTLKAQQGPVWVKASERLPEPDQRVMVYNDGLFLVFLKFWPAGFKNNDEPCFIGLNDKGPYGLDEITHWAPLPPGPPADTLNPELLQVIRDAEKSKEDDLKAVKEVIGGAAAGREADKARFDNWHRWLSDNGYTYDGEYYYDEDNNYFTPDQLWVKFK